MDNYHFDDPEYKVFLRFGSQNSKISGIFDRNMFEEEIEENSDKEVEKDLELEEPMPIPESW